MSQTSPTLPPVQPVPRQRPKWPARIGIAAAVVVALGGGVGIGTASNSQTSKINALNGTIGADQAKISQLQGTVSSLRGQNSTLNGQLVTETNTANHALAAATAKVKAQDAAEQAKLNSEAATLKSQQARLAALTGMTQSNQISQDGVYVVGRDMKGGTWHTSGGGQCYEATLTGLDTSNPSDIINNNNFSGPDTVDLTGVYAFDISGGCTWVKIG